MKLDKRIIKGKKYLDCFDSEYAKQFIGTKGFITDELRDFCDLSKIKMYELKSVYQTETYSYSSGVTGHKYFLLAEWVKEPKKKYRPFSIEDWKFKHSVGKTILYRYKGTYCDDHREVEVMYLGYVKPLDGITDEAGKGELVLGNESLGLQNLFNNYEIWADGEWKPFGIEVEE